MQIDLDPLYADFPDNMSWNPPYDSETITHPVYFIQPDTVILDGAAYASDLQVRFIAAQFNGLDVGAIVRINGEPYKVREIKTLTFGKEKIASLGKIEF